MARYHAMEFRFDDPRIAALKISGTLGKGDRYIFSRVEGRAKGGQGKALPTVTAKPSHQFGLL
jgi:hypothetical protein